MREIRTYGSEGGEARKGLPYPYHCFRKPLLRSQATAKGMWHRRPACVFSEQWSKIPNERIGGLDWQGQLSCCNANIHHEATP